MAIYSSLGESKKKVHLHRKLPPQGQGTGVPERYPRGSEAAATPSRNNNDKMDAPNLGITIVWPDAGNT
eukprot:9342244-Pyramimonas_sp.AAC.3